MTVMDQRWWAPSEPGIGPDEFDLELLQPGDDPKADLGQAFLALHRVGAAACEAVATQPLADEDALAFALANARKIVAPEASEIVSKAVGDNPNYGNLLLRDVLDDAEATALSLWRSCIAKSVPAQITAKRVGMVYGLPPGELYTFQKLATDPKANPVALQEAADKALFTHVAKLVAEEAVERKVEVSKQRPPRAARQQWWEEEPRNPQGEWAEEKTTGDVEPAAPPPPAPVRRPERLARAQRPERQVRVSQQARETSAAAQAGREVGVTVGTDVGVTVGHEVSANALRTAGGPLTRVLEGLGTTGGEEAAAASGRARGETPDPTKPYLGREHGEYLDKTMAFVLTTPEWLEFQKEAGSAQSGRTFYAGRLQEYAGLPNVYKDEHDLTTIDHEQLVKAEADRAKEDAGLDPRMVKTFRLTHFQGMDSADVEDETKAWMMRPVAQGGLGMPEHEVERELGTHVEWIRDLHDPNKAMYAVYHVKPRNKPRDAARPIASVTEVVVDKEDLFGDYQSRGGEDQYRLNRQQVLITSGVFAPGGKKNQRFWDDEHKVIRNVVYTHVTDEEINKAMSPERFHQLEEQGRIARDERGEFAEVEAEAPAAPARAVRAQRQQRQQRLVARPVGTSAGVTVGGAVGREVGRAVGQTVGRSAAVEAAFEAVAPTKKPRPPEEGFTLADGFDYTAIPHFIHLPTDNHPVVPSLRAWQAIQKAEMGDSIDVEQAAQNQHGLAHTTRGQARRESRVRTFQNVTVEGLEDVAYEIHKMMGKEDPNEPFFTLARIKTLLNDDDTADIVVYRNTDSLGTRDVVRWEDAGPDDTYRLSFERSGRFWTPRMIRHWLHGAWDSALKSGHETGHYVDDDYLADPWVRVWRADAVSAPRD